MKAINKSRVVTLLIFLCLLSVGIFGFYQVSEADSVFYNIKCWNFADAFFPGGTLGSCAGQDIDGKVGYPLFVNGLRARCEPDNDWHTSRKIITSGSFPPGIGFKSGTSHITGIPEKRGHWIVRIKVEHLYCQDKSYYGIEQELRFHISGTGKVNY